MITSGHLLSVKDLTRDGALEVLDTARELSRITDGAIKKLPTLRGRTVVNLFFEDSTRTRLSFEGSFALWLAFPTSDYYAR